MSITHGTRKHLPPPPPSSSCKFKGMTLPPLVHCSSAYIPLPPPANLQNLCCPLFSFLRRHCLYFCILIVDCSHIRETISSYIASCICICCYIYIYMLRRRGRYKRDSLYRKLKLETLVIVLSLYISKLLVHMLRLQLFFIIARTIVRYTVTYTSAVIWH
jgi:hypothetical protein